MKKYKQYKELNLPQIDKEMLQFWKDNNVFERSMKEREGNESFVFYEGPPSANGQPGIHHVLARSVKDTFCRYQTMKGKLVRRKAGWDTHGLPIELAVEKKLGITKEDIGKKISIEDYNEECKKTVMMYKDLWDDLTTRMGYWVDLENPYITYENSYIESVWYLLRRLYDKGLLYKGYTIQPYSPAAGTGLSSHELNQPGCYKEVKDTTAVAMFKVVRNEQSAFLFGNEQEDVRILAWTTTPWTLPSNTALTVGGKIQYVKVQTFNPYTAQPVSVVLAKDLVGKWFKTDGETLALEYKTGDKVLPYRHIATFAGEQLAGVRYEQLLPFGNAIESLDGATDAFRVILGDFVTTEDGTGVVHTAPSFGADDRKAAKANGIGTLTLVDKQGKFVDTVGEFSGRYVKNYTNEADYQDVDVDIAVKLKTEGYAFNVQKYAHNYPHCWRTDKPILYYPLDSWFVAASKLKERMFELNQTINWKPASTGEGRFGNWLKNLQDWNLSRSRYWGIPLPIWRAKDNTITPQKMNANEVVTLVESTLRQTFAAVDLWFDKQVDLQTYRPKNGGWTVSQVLEHIALTNQYLMILVDKGVDKSLKNVQETNVAEVWENYQFPQSKLSEVGLHQSFEWIRPEHMEPTGASSLAQVRETLQTQLAQCLAYLQQVRNGEGVAYRTTMTVNELGKIDVYEYLYFLAQHARRHLTQMLKNEAEWADTTVASLTEKCIGSLEQMATEIEKANKVLGLQQSVPADLHRPYIDNVVLVADNGERMQRETDLIDVWFDSGAMPYAQWHYPFENKELIDNALNRQGGEVAYPADFIAEGVDQTRGWFYTLHAIAVMCFDSVAYKNVVSNGLVLDKLGRKMSKRLGNAVDPFDTIDKNGADATRWYMLTNAQPWDDLRFDMDGLEEVRRSFFGTLYNTYNFFATYANVDGFDGSQKPLPLSERTELDRWIISLLNSLVKDVDADFANYEPTQAGRRIAEFVDKHLSNWYVRLGRRRFWSKGDFAKSESNNEKLAAYQTLYECLVTIAKLMSPIAPFFADRLYKDLNDTTNVEPHTSVHLAFFPQVNESAIDKALEQRMDYAQRLASLVLSLRKREKVRVRQPLQKMLIPILDSAFQTQIDKVKELILSEVNVKELEYVTDTSGMVKKRIKPNFKTLGKKLGGNMKAAQTLIEAFTQEQINQLEKTGVTMLQIAEATYELPAEDFSITSEDIEGWLVANDGALTVALDMTLTPMLEAEGTARELVNRIQNLRKDKDFDVTDRITLTLEKHDVLNQALAHFKDYICNEVLATSLELVDSLTAGDEVELFENTNLRLVVVRN